jgi:hypothetical protein
MYPLRLSWHSTKTGYGTESWIIAVNTEVLTSLTEMEVLRGDTRSRFVWKGNHYCRRVAMLCQHRCKRHVDLHSKAECRLFGVQEVTS